MSAKLLSRAMVCRLLLEVWGKGMMQSTAQARDEWVWDE